MNSDYVLKTSKAELKLTKYIGRPYPICDKDKLDLMLINIFYHLRQLVVLYLKHIDVQDMFTWRNDHNTPYHSSWVIQPTSAGSLKDLYLENLACLSGKYLSIWPTPIPTPQTHTYGLGNMCVIKSSFGALDHCISRSVHTHWGHWWRRLQPTSSIITDAKSLDSNLDYFAR